MMHCGLSNPFYLTFIYLIILTFIYLSYNRDDAVIFFEVEPNDELWSIKSILFDRFEHMLEILLLTE